MVRRAGEWQTRRLTGRENTRRNPGLNIDFVWYLLCSPRYDVDLRHCGSVPPPSVEDRGADWPIQLDSVKRTREV